MPETEYLARHTGPSHIQFQLRLQPSTFSYNPTPASSQNAFTRSRGGLPIGDGISLNSGVHPVADIPLHDQFSCGNDYALKPSDFGQENNSPKSVLSTVVSETLGSSDSDTPTRCLSPTSSISDVPTNRFPLAEPKTSFEEEGSPPSSAHDKQPPVKLEFFHKESVSTKDDATEESSGRTLKLFGTTLLITDTCKPSSPTMEPWKPTPAAAMYLMQLQNGCSDITEGPASIVPWWSLPHNTPFMPLHKEPKGNHIYSNLGEFVHKEVQKEGSWTGSNTSSINDGDNIEKSDDQAKSHVHCFSKSEISSISELRVRPKTCGKGFVPCKRRMAERESKYSSICYEEREEQGIKLSL
ncbi:hypothetical protein JHK87_005093 [Glycine soja]|nr:hypothetical protein JHK87_005093 [Glycine soja]